MPRSNVDKLRPVILLLAMITSCASMSVAQATETVLYNLNAPGSNGGLIFDQNGNLYGSITGRGTSYGGIFQLHRFVGGTWGVKILYRFLGGVDGAEPQTNLIFDSTGNLYGTAALGGSFSCDQIRANVNCGIVFKLTPNPTGKWTKTVLYNFAGGTDGSLPSGGVIFDEVGNLYGTTAFGGDHIWGTVFELSPNPDGTWSNKTLYSFTGGSDGRGPSGGVVRDRAGNLYGTTFAGGNAENGTVFQLSPNADGSWTFRSLYQFCSSPGCRNGARPNPVVLDAHGNLYGTTQVGGTVGLCFTQDGCGTLYRLSHGSGGTWTFQLLHKFCSAPECADGMRPSGGLVFDKLGAFYGTTMNSVFKVNHVPGTPWSVDTLHTFCLSFPCVDGAFPVGRLLLDSPGNLYGTTLGGGTAPFQDGVVFELIP